MWKGGEKVMAKARFKFAYEDNYMTTQALENYVARATRDDLSALRSEYTRMRDVAQKRIKRLQASEFNQAKAVLERPEGFPKLKISLAAAVGKEGYNENNMPFDKEDNPKLIFNKVFNSGINTLKNTCQMIDFSKIDEISKKLASAQRIFIFGVGTSSVVAIDSWPSIS